MKALIRVCFVVLVLVSGYGYAYGAEGWEAALKVSVPRAYNRLSFGQKADATDGIDGAYDVPAMLNGDIKASFLLKDGSYWRDIKAVASGEVKKWRIRVESGLAGTVITLSWNPASLPAGVALTDMATATVIDMKSVGTYSYNNDGAREFLIEVASTR